MSTRVYSASFCVTRSANGVHSVFASWRRPCGRFLPVRTSDSSTCFISRHHCSGFVVHFNDYFFWGVGCMTSNSWLNFGDEVDRDADTGIFKWNFYCCGIGQFYEICRNKSCQRNFLTGRDVSLAINTWFWCCSVSCSGSIIIWQNFYHCGIREIVTVLHPNLGSVSWAAFVDVCRLRVILILE